jgi:hypothetical protein
MEELSGRWLLVARLAWLAGTSLAVGIFVVGSSLYFADLQQVCASAARVCEQQAQLTPENVHQLQELGLPTGFWAWYNSAINLVFMAVWGGVGAIIFLRKSDDRMALLVSLFLVTFPVAFSLDPSEALARAYPALQLPVRAVQYLADVLAMLFFYLFPSGRFVPSWTRWVALGWIAQRAVNDLFPELLGQPGGWPELLYFLAFAGFLASFVIAQVYRYRRVSSPPQREQTKWVVFGTSVALAGTLAFLLPFAFVESSDMPAISALLLIQTAGGHASMLLIPLSIGVAVLRSRLFDIDVIINRTIVYGSLTVTLVAFYFGGVVALQKVFVALTEQASTLAVVASTLAIAALFNPLRRRVQGFVDRRFYRRKYDVRKTLEAFSAKLRDETDLQALNDHLVGVVVQTMQPEHVGLWLRPDVGLKS